MRVLQRAGPRAACLAAPWQLPAQPPHRLPFPPPFPLPLRLPPVVRPFPLLLDPPPLGSLPLPPPRLLHRFLRSSSPFEISLDLGRARGKGRGEATLTTTTTTTTTVALTTTTTVTFSTTLRSQHISETRTGLEKEIQRVKVKERTGLKKGISKDLLTEPRKGPAKGSMENQQCLQVKAKREKRKGPARLARSGST